MLPSLPSPWKEFLGELDTLLDEPIELHCIGGFAVVAGYGLPRGTNDLDYRALSKLTRNNERDRQDVEFLAKTLHLDPVVFKERYEKELRPILIGPESRHDLTLELWLEAYFEKPVG